MWFSFHALFVIFPLVFCLPVHFLAVRMGRCVIVLFIWKMFFILCDFMFTCIFVKKRPLISHDKEVLENLLSSVCEGKFGGKYTCTNFNSHLFSTTPPGAIRHGATCDRYSFKVCYVGQVLTAEGKQWQNITASLWQETISINLSVSHPAWEESSLV